MADSITVELQNDGTLGMSCLIEVLEAIDTQGGHMAFCQATPTIGKTLRIMGLLLRATLHESEEDALEALGDAIRSSTPSGACCRTAFCVSCQTAMVQHSDANLI